MALASNSLQIINDRLANQANVRVNVSPQLRTQS